MLRMVFGAAMAMLVQSCAVTPYDIDGVVKAREEIPKSPNDDRRYRYLQLANDLRVVLISDQDTDRAAASLSVYRGNYSDPKGHPGLAHFLEHMLFVGTTKYPNPDGFSSFVESHGGTQNASTGNDYTNFFFDVQPTFFRQAMDRFTQFFVSPKLEYDYVEREKNAVDSEYRLFLKDDAWRAQMVRTVTANPDHPYVKFSIGNLETLGSDVHEALRTFFDNEYSANQMGLVVLSNESLDAIESWVVPMAMEIKNKDLAPARVPEPLFLPGQLPATLTHQSLAEDYSLRFSFPVPLLDPHYRQKPGSYLANLIGHEGEGSLHRSLLEKGWITWLSAGGVKVDNATSLLAVSMGLTQKGRDHVPQITDLLFDYIELLKSQAPEEWRFREQAIVSDLAFRFEEKRDPMLTVYGMSLDLAFYPPKDLLTYHYQMDEFDPQLINDYLGYLNLDNVLLEISGPDVEVTDVEPWFQVGYSLRRGKLSMIETASGDLRLPDPNTFLPRDLTIREDDGQAPHKIFDDKHGQIWFDVDTEFGVPRSNIDVSLRDAGGLISLQDVVMAGLYKRLVWDDLNTLVYPAFLAGVGYRVSSPPKGFRISTFGYHDRQLVLLDQVLDSFVNLNIKPDRFDVLKGELLRNLRNFQRDLPFRQTQSAVHDLLLSSSWGAVEQADYLESISLGDVMAWREDKLEAVDVLAMVHGNVAVKDVENLRTVLDKHLSLQDFMPKRPKVREVDRAYLHEVIIDHDDASIVLRVQDTDDSFRSQAKSRLLSHLLYSAFFASLRTDQQLGYVVQVHSGPVYRIGGVTFLIQSPVAPADVLEQKIVDFVEHQIRVIEGYSRREFDVYKQGLIDILLETDKNLSDRSSRYWNDLDLGIYTFDSNHQIADEVEKLSKHDMVMFIKRIRSSLEDERLLVFSRGKFDTVPVNGAPL